LIAFVTARNEAESCKRCCPLRNDMGFRVSGAAISAWVIE